MWPPVTKLAIRELWDLEMATLRPPNIFNATLGEETKPQPASKVKK
jgi:hypothetical protein